MATLSETIRLESMRQYGFGAEAMKALKVCTRCGTMADATATFCKECRARLPQETLFQLYRRRHGVCPECETVIPDSAQFCPQCGCRVRERSK